MACPHQTLCPLYKLFGTNATLGVWKVLYCGGQFDTCERYRRSQLGEQIDDNLLPNGKTLDVTRR